MYVPNAPLVRARSGALILTRPDVALLHRERLAEMAAAYSMGDKRLAAWAPLFEHIGSVLPF
jgi:hypothetical protein